MKQRLEELHAAVARAVQIVAAREKDGSFLERTLRDAIAQELTPPAAPERPLNLASWDANLGNVDLLWFPQGATAPVGIETKVWDVGDSLYDLLKLASATAEGSLSLGFVVAAGRSRDWRRTHPIVRLCDDSARLPALSSTVALLEEAREHWERLLGDAAAKPRRLPSHIETLAARPIQMPSARDHEVRIVAVRAASDDAERDREICGYLASAMRQRDADLLDRLKPGLHATHDATTAALLAEFGATRIAAAIDDRIELHEEAIADFIADDYAGDGTPAYSSEEVASWSLQSLRRASQGVQAACLAEAFLIADDDLPPRPAGTAWVVLELPLRGGTSIDDCNDTGRSAVGPYRLGETEAPWRLLEPTDDSDIS